MTRTARSIRTAVRLTFYVAATYLLLLIVNTALAAFWFALLVGALMSLGLVIYVARQRRIFSRTDVSGGSVAGGGPERSGRPAVGTVGH